MNSGSGGALFPPFESGTISTSGFTTHQFNNASNRSLTITNGTGTLSQLGSIVLAGLQLSNPGNLNIEANLNVTLTGDFTATTMMSITAGGGSITMSSGLLTTSTLNLNAGINIGASGLPLLTSVSTLTTDTSANGGDQFITEAGGWTALEIDAGTGDVTLNVTAGGVFDTDPDTDITAAAASVTLSDVNNGPFGSLANPIQTSVDGLSVATQPGSTQHIRELNGLTALNLVAGTGVNDTVALTVAAGAVSDGDTNTDIITFAATITLSDPTARNFGTSLKPIHTSVAAPLVDTSAGGGDQFINAGGVLLALNLNAGQGDVTLTRSSGAVADSDEDVDIRANKAVVTLNDPQARAVSIETAVNSLQISTAAGDGNQFITESDGLTALELDAGENGRVVLQVTAGAIADTDGAVDVVGNQATVLLNDPTAQDYGSSANPIISSVRNLTISTSAGGGDQHIIQDRPLNELDLNTGSQGTVNLLVTGGGVADSDDQTDITADLAIIDATFKVGGFPEFPIKTSVNELIVTTINGGGRDQFITEVDGLTALNLNAGTMGDITLQLIAGAVVDIDSDLDITASAARIDLGDPTPQNVGAAGAPIRISVDELTVFTGGSQFIAEENGLENLNLFAGLNGNISLTVATGGISATAGTIGGGALSVSLNDPIARNFGTSANPIRTSVNEIAVNTSTGGGNQFISEFNGLTAVSLDAGSGDITLSLANGAVSDVDTTADITSSTGSVTLLATNSNFNIFGATDNPIQTNVNNLSVNTAAGNGDQFIHELPVTTISNLDAGTGSITLVGGTFSLSTGNAIGDNSTLVVNSLAAVNLAGVNETIGGLAGSGTVAFKVDGLSGDLIVGGNNVNTIFDGTLIGNDTLSGQPIDTFRKVGLGTLAFSGTHTFTGAYEVVSGKLLVNGNLAASSKTINVEGPTAVLGGTGTTGRQVNVATGAMLAPGDSPGSLSTGRLAFSENSTFDVEITSVAAGQFDQVDVTGIVTIITAGNGVALRIGTAGTLNLQAGDQWTLIDNDGGADDPVQGTFKNLPEGAAVGGANFLDTGLRANISYVGGDGNDVVLTLVAPVEFPWHNFAKPLDVNGGPNNAPDGFVVAGDALSIINYINSVDFTAVPANATQGQPFGYLDTTGDNNVAPDDVLSVINAINADLGGEGESIASHEQASHSAGREIQPLSPSGQFSTDELIGLLALDVALQPKRRR